MSEFGEFFSETEVQTELLQAMCSFDTLHSHVWWHHDQREIIQDWVDKLEFGQPTPLDVSWTKEDEDNCEQQFRAMEALAFLAIGGGYGRFESREMHMRAIRHNAELLWDGNVLYPVLTLFCSILSACEEESVLQNSFQSEKRLEHSMYGGHGLSQLIRFCCNVLYVMFISLGEVDAFRHLVSEFRYAGQDFIVFLFHVVKDLTGAFGQGPAFPHAIPIKKVLLVLWKVAACVLGPLDFLPAPHPCGPTPTGVRSGVRAHREDVLQYISGVRQSPPFAHLSEEYLLAYYYSCFNHEDHPRFASYKRPEYKEFDHMAIPFPVREGLATLCRQHETQHRTAVRRGFQPFPLQPDQVSPLGPGDSHEVPPLPLPHHQVLDEDSGDEDEEEDGEMYSRARQSEGPPRGLMEPKSPVEALYSGLLPVLPTGVLSLLKIFLAALPNASSIHVDLLMDLFPDEGALGSDDGEEGAKVQTEMKRHKEIILKAVSFILLLLLKHFQRNHPLQAAYLKQLVVDANGILLILKYLNQKDIVAFVESIDGHNFVDELAEFEQTPSALLVDSEGLFAELSSSPVGIATSTVPIEGGMLIRVVNRCMYGCVNFVRLLHKLTKANASRLSVVTSYKVQVMMKRLFRLQQPELLLYAMKILKSILRAVGRKWRASNMKLYSLVYKMVRHDLCDLNLYLETGPETSDPVDFPLPPGHVTDHQIARQVRAFNLHEYTIPTLGLGTDSGTVRGASLDDDWKAHYEVWVDKLLGFPPLRAQEGPTPLGSDEGGFSSEDDDG